MQTFLWLFFENLAAQTMSDGKKSAAEHWKNVCSGFRVKYFFNKDINYIIVLASPRHSAIELL